MSQYDLSSHDYVTGMYTLNFDRIYNLSEMSKMYSYLSKWEELSFNAETKRKVATAVLYSFTWRSLHD